MSDPRLTQAAAMAGARPQDIELEREMEGGETETTPSIPAGNLDADEVEAAQENARGGLGQGPAGTPFQNNQNSRGQNPGAPWDNVDDAARMTPDQFPDEQGR